MLHRRPKTVLLGTLLAIPALLSLVLPASAHVVLCVGPGHFETAFTVHGTCEETGNCREEINVHSACEDTHDEHAACDHVEDCSDAAGGCYDLVLSGEDDHLTKVQPPVWMPPVPVLLFVLPIESLGLQALQRPVTAVPPDLRCPDVGLDTIILRT